MNGNEYLHNVGANIAAFLDPFGIDVSYEVRDGDEKKNGHFSTNGSGSWGCGTGPIPGMWHWGTSTSTNAGGCTRMPQTPKPSGEGEHHAEASAEQTGRKDAEMEIPVTLEEKATGAEAQETPRDKEPSPSGSNDEDWTMLNEGETTTDGKVAEDAVPVDNLYPNLKVTKSVELMKSMGFNDDGGWLTRLLETTDGDIVQALDTLKLGAQQASRLA